MDLQGLGFRGALFLIAEPLCVSAAYGFLACLGQWQEGVSGFCFCGSGCFRV